MTNYPCPRCGTILQLTPDMSGATVACPNCAQQLLVPAMPPAMRGVSIQPARTSDRQFKQAASLLDVFDLKFEKYVTPLIIRVTWAIVLAFAVLWIVVVVAGSIMSLMPETDTESSRVRTTIELPESLKSVQRSADDSVERGWARAYNVLLALTQIAFIGLAVLWVRVSLETVIVVFNIAKTLTSMDNKLPASTE